MINECILIGAPIAFGAICKIYPPTVREVVSEQLFSSYYNLLSKSHDDLIDDILEKDKKADISQIPLPLKFILTNCQKSSTFDILTKKAFEFFIHEEVSFVFEQNKVLIGGLKALNEVKDPGQLRFITEENFFDFQNIIRQTVGAETIEKQNENEDPMLKDFRAKQRRRKRIVQKSKRGGVSLSTSLASICCMGIGLTPLNIGEISYASVRKLIEVYQQKERYQIDVDTLLAGGDPKKVKPKYWISENSEFQEIKI